MAEQKTVISIKKPTPQWANYTFRIVLLMATTLNTVIVAAPGIPESVKLSIVFWSGTFVTFIWGLSRIVGVQIEDQEPPVKLMDGPQDIVGGRPDDRNKDKP